MPLRAVEEVKAQLLGLVRATRKTEMRSLDEALGCCLAEDVRAAVNVPPANSSTMDGYALACDDLAPGKSYDVSDRIPAGRIGGRLRPGTLARIFTGGRMPAGADTVIMQEETRLVGGKVRLLAMPGRADNVRRKGQDVQAGAVVARQGEPLTPRALALIASVGVSRIKVASPLRVAVMATGDELIEPGRAPGPGQSFNASRYALAGMLKQMGMEVIDLGIIGDAPEATQEALLAAAADADCILTSGGVSVGEEDHVKAAVQKLGRIELWKLAIKPGKPLAYGEVRGRPFFGLPGNPVSTFVTFHLIARPCLLAMQGFTRVEHETRRARASFEFRGGSRREYLRVRLHPQASPTPSAELFPDQSSGMMMSLVWADALAEVEPARHVKPGDLLKVFPLSGV